MSNFSIRIVWRRATPDCEYKTFNRDHAWHLAGGQIVRGSAAPEYFGDPETSNLEEALLAARRRARTGARTCIGVRVVL
jgi:hypothetical protein